MMFLTDFPFPGRKRIFGRRKLKERWGMGKSHRRRRDGRRGRGFVAASATSTSSAMVVVVPWNVASEPSQVCHELRPNVTRRMSGTSNDAAVDAVVSLFVVHVVDVFVVVVVTSVVALRTSRTERAV